MGAVHHKLEPVQILLIRERALAELDVAASRILDAARAAEIVRTHTGHRLLELGFDLLLHLVRQLVARRREKLDAVVVVRIVARGNDHARRQPQRAGQVGHARRG
ncbi:hypothetical protein D3C81_1915570 [compost metagenome]